MNKLLEIAFEEYGITETKGKKDNPRIIDYFNVVGFDGEKLKDETAWCSAFVNFVAIIGGYESTSKLNARSWLDVGEDIDIDKINLGDVLVFWRESKSSWKGHVGFYIKEDAHYYWVLGGNQSNSVCIKRYPKKRLLKAKRLCKL